MSYPSSMAGIVTVPLVQRGVDRRGAGQHLPVRVQQSLQQRGQRGRGGYSGVMEQGLYQVVGYSRVMKQGLYLVVGYSRVMEQGLYQVVGYSRVMEQGLYQVAGYSRVMEQGLYQVVGYHGAGTLSGRIQQSHGAGTLSGSRIQLSGITPPRR